MTDREPDDPDGRAPERELPEPAGPRVVGLTELAASATPPAPVASFDGLGAGAGRGSSDASDCPGAPRAVVVDLSAYRREAGAAQAGGVDDGRGPAASADAPVRSGGTRRPGYASTDKGEPRRTGRPGPVAADDGASRRAGRLSDATADEEARRAGRSGGSRAGETPRRGVAPANGPGSRPGGLRPAGGSAGGRTGVPRSDGAGESDPGADPVAVAREICLRLLTERARTRQELAQALRKRGVPDDAADTVLERFDEVGLIDDAAFAGQWVRSRHAGRGLARRALAVELRRRGVTDEVAQEALAEVDATAEEQRARALVERKLRSIAIDTPERRATAARRLVGMLARRGYPGGIAYRVVREALAAAGADDDEFGTEPD